MRIIVLALALVSGIAQAQSYNPYAGAQQRLDAEQERKAMAEERKLRMELMEAQKQSIKDQQLYMDTQILDRRYSDPDSHRLGRLPGF